MLSGVVDAASYEASATLQEMVQANPGMDAAPTRCSYILPEYLNQGLGDPYRVSVHDSIWYDRLTLLEPARCFCQRLDPSTVFRRGESCRTERGGGAQLRKHPYLGK